MKKKKKKKKRKKKKESNNGIVLVYINKLKQYSPLIPFKRVEQD